VQANFTISASLLFGELLTPLVRGYKPEMREIGKGAMRVTLGHGTTLLMFGDNRSID